MRIIRPYGRSATRPGAGDGAARVRVLRLREVPGGGGSAEREIAPFASSEDALVIAQWISTIDKIATKPKGDKKPTQAQRDLRDLRERLGKAGWDFIVEKKLLPGLAADADGYFKKLWDFKIAPYPDGTYTPPEGKQPPSPKGRWYARFAGDVAPEDVNAAEVAASIHEHLYTAAYRMADGRPNHPMGRIEARAASIAANSLSLERAGARERTWTDDDRRSYEEKGGNIAEQIRQAATAQESAHRRVGVDVAARVLHEAWPKLFDGEALSFKDARDRSPGLVDLHEAIRDRYSRTLKRHGKDQKAHGEHRRKVSTLLPATMEGLFALVDSTLENRDLAALVRLGKVIHYQAATAQDTPADVVNHWPAADAIAASHYWSSDGQAEIKRNEAFVRIWRHSLALARQTLVDWADPGGRINTDILLGGGITQAIGTCFDPRHHERKLKLLFGSRSALFTDSRDDAVKKETLRVALKGVADLRHSAFHFKGLGGFSQALHELSASGDVLAKIRDLWVEDIQGRAERLRQTMVGAHFDCFFKKEQNRKLFEAVIGAAGDVPLPRFRRLLERAHNIAGTGAIKLKLPPPANRLALQEQPARLCQYVALKLLYEHPFRGWLGGLDAATINGFIDRAVERTEQAARSINAGRNKDRRALITAKARALGRLADGERIQDFLERLTAETASEMRVQRGYASDAESAREQAGYIDELLCDVLAQAFETYLDQQGFRFVTHLRPDAAQPGSPVCALDSLSPAAVDTTVADWQAILYFLLHLVPVEEAGRLLHQIRKWDILAGKAEGAPLRTTKSNVAPITKALELYLDMHDAKFTGGEALQVIDDFKQLFANKALFDEVFPATAAGAEDERLPLRGLREILRFGNLERLLPIFQQHRISQVDVEKVRADENANSSSSPIADAQAKRETLHEKWSKKRKEFSESDRRAYVEALAFVMVHRHLAAQVRLVNHVRLHHLMMAVLGRLVDFSGLWERDLYFAMLALLSRQGLSPQQVFQGDGLNKLERGQVVEACRNLDLTVRADLAPHFGSPDSDFEALVRIRNTFAHFNMLRGNAAPDLTKCINDARELMAYDRKLKNAVAQAVIELLARDGFALRWTMDATSADHMLNCARVATRQAKHLGSESIRESLHGPCFVEMVAVLFGGQMSASDCDVSQLPLDLIDWEKVGRPREGGAGKRRIPQGKAHPGRRHRRKVPRE
ncbi:conserved hypothetical protein [uncultured Defluviicoccus sp.]|uniref:Uncharacterized protein n=1 Tax=metagenome TaxID=256318 RepID=A0A380TBU3_9ZZZZ|nr:conserved hypothetical protein [uncultured Defluviicoccus sp.]